MLKNNCVAFIPVKVISQTEEPVDTTDTIQQQHDEWKLFGLTKGKSHLPCRCGCR